MYNIEKLAELSGVTRRTVRFYIQKGLLEPPEGQKRGSYYTESHLKRIRQIKQLLARGVHLDKMNNFLKESPELEPPAEGNIKFSLSSNCNKSNNTKISNFSRVSINNEIELNFTDNALQDEEIEKISLYIQRLLKKRSS